MMRKSNFQLLLLLLLIAVTPRNSSANPVDNGPIVAERGEDAITNNQMATIPVDEIGKEAANPVDNSPTDAGRGEDANTNNQMATNPVDDGIKDAEIGKKAANPVDNGIERGEDTNTNSQIATKVAEMGEESKINIIYDEIDVEAELNITDAEIGVEAILNSKIATDFRKGTIIMKDAVDYFNKNDPSSQFHKDIHQLEIDILNVPRKLAENREEMLKGLYRSQDQLMFLRNTLRLAAENLKRYCKNLIKIYDKYEDSDSQEIILQYTAKKFVRYASLVKRLLDDALQKTLELNTNMGDMKVWLQVFKADMKHEEADVIRQQERLGDIRGLKNDLKRRQTEFENTIKSSKDKQRNINLGVCLGTAWFTGGLSCAITLVTTGSVLGNKIENARILLDNINKKIWEHEDKQRDLDDLTDLLNQIRPAMKSALILFKGVSEVKEYLEEEIILIEAWQVSLTEAIVFQRGLEREIALRRKEAREEARERRKEAREEAEMMDGEDYDDMFAETLAMEIAMEKKIKNDLLKDDIKEVKKSLTDLIQACDNYLDHKAPGILDFPPRPKAS